MPSKTNENIVTVIQALLWIGAVSFLIWYTVIELQKVKDTDYLPPSIVDVKELTFPSIIICPSVDALFKTNASWLPNNTVSLTYPAAVNPGLPWDTNPGASYLVCPARVSFTSPSGTTANCVDFTSAPEQDDSIAAGCDVYATKAKWTPGAPGEPATPWKTKTVDTVIELTGILNDANNNYPLVALLYSDDGNSIFKKPKTFADYRQQFAVSVADRVLIPLMATTNLYIKKYIRDDYPIATDCNIEDYETQQDNWGYVTPPESPIYPNCTGVPNCDPTPQAALTGATVFLTYDSLAVTTTCHLTKHPLVFGDVLGIVGGGIAIVLAITLFLSRIITWCASRGETGQINDQYKNMV